MAHAWRRLGAPIPDGEDDVVKTGDEVPDFELPDQQGNRVALGDLLARGPVVLYFYIRAKTPG